MYINPSKRHQSHTTIAGLEVVIVPRPSLLRVILDGVGNPKMVSTQNQHYTSDGFKDWDTLKGLNLSDVTAFNPDLVIYQLDDGSLLTANRDAIVKATEDNHSASSTDTRCLLHKVSDLRLLKAMPEFQPDIDFFG